MTTSRRRFGAVLVGGGPAGLAVLLAAHKDGRLTEMLERGLLIVERGPQIGHGQIGNYIINSDSTGETFVAPLRAGSDARIHAVLEDPVARRIEAAGQQAVSLHDAARLQVLIGQALHAIIDDSPQSEVLTNCVAQSACLQEDGSWQVTIAAEDGQESQVHATKLILATGATQPHARLEQESFAGVPLVQRWGDRLIQSGDLLSNGRVAEVAALLKGKADPKVAILGGSTSAMSVAHVLLKRLPEVEFGEGAVRLFHRRPLRVYYATPEEALADGYGEFGPDDLCTLTNRVYRLAGLRLESRELLMQLRGIGGRSPEPRMTMHQLKPQDASAIRFIDSAHLVVAALGYRPNALRILDGKGEEIVLFAATGMSAPMVDDGCRVMDRFGNPIPGLFGIGLAAGFVPRGKLGGEPSFKGQANGLWLWQNDIGSIIVEAVVKPTVEIELPMRKRTVRESASKNHDNQQVPAGLGMEA